MSSFLRATATDVTPQLDELYCSVCYTSMRTLKTCVAEAWLVVPRIARRSGARLAGTLYATCNLWHTYVECICRDEQTWVSLASRLYARGPGNCMLPFFRLLLASCIIGRTEAL